MAAQPGREPATDTATKLLVAPVRSSLRQPYGLDQPPPSIATTRSLPLSLAAITTSCVRLAIPNYKCKTRSGRRPRWSRATTTRKKRRQASRLPARVLPCPDATSGTTVAFQSCARLLPHAPTRAHARPGVTRAREAPASQPPCDRGRERRSHGG